jgi:hypothetical protein
MFDDDPWFIFKAMTMMFLFVVVPWVFLLAVNPEGKINIEWTQPQKEELAACQANNEQIVDNRDVYCVKEFGRPDNTWQWVFGTIWMIVGLVTWIGGKWAADKLLQEAQAKAKAKKSK